MNHLLTILRESAARDRVVWLGWRGQWIHARQTWRRWLADPWTEAEAAEVWAEMGWPE
jgi:hypothetical protein